MKSAQVFRGSAPQKQTPKLKPQEPSSNLESLETTINFILDELKDYKTRLEDLENILLKKD